MESFNAAGLWISSRRTQIFLQSPKDGDFRHVLERLSSKRKFRYMEAAGFRRSTEAPQSHFKTEIYSSKEKESKEVHSSKHEHFVYPGEKELAGILNI